MPPRHRTGRTICRQLHGRSPRSDPVRNKPRSTPHEAPAGRRRGQGVLPRGGFTLIEVLVVVAIIALLAAILLPALRESRNQVQAAVCGSNLKQAVAGTLIYRLEQGMRRERVSTNFGWAVPSYRVNKECGEIFTCPADPRPRPTPALQAEIYEGGFSIYRGSAFSDGVFNRVFEEAGEWNLDIQDTVDQRGFGRDSGTNDRDLLLSFKAVAGQKNATVGVRLVESAWDFRVRDFRGRMLWPNAKSASGQHTVPLLWMSYGANAPAGLLNVRGNPILVAEHSKPGIFPESYAGKGAYGGGQPNDLLPQTLRYRHGPRLSDSRFKDANDKTYVARERMNVGFLDGSVSRLSYLQMTQKDVPQVVNGELQWHRALWLGSRRGGETRFD